MSFHSHITKKHNIHFYCSEGHKEIYEVPVIYDTCSNIPRAKYGFCRTHTFFWPISTCSKAIEQNQNLQKLCFFLAPAFFEIYKNVRIGMFYF